MTFAVGTLIAAISLAVIKFPKQAEPSAVPQNKINALADVSIIIALLFGAGAIYCFTRYDLTRKRHAEIREALLSGG